jgi:hypothetical protein
MKLVLDRTLDLANGALMGFLAVFVVALSAVLILFAVTVVAGISSLDLAVGPFPFASMWHSSARFGFQTQWALGALCLLGAVLGLGLALRRQMVHAA